MKVPFVDLHAQYLSIKDDIDSAIANVISETAFIGGEPVKSFEKNYAELYGVKHCIGVANGTDSLYIAMKMLGIGTGDEVITVANSWISTSETIGQTGAKPVFVDIELNYFTIDVNKIEEKITSKTKAIIPVHLYGHPADMDPILALCKKHNLKLIEDCAQAHFAEYKGKRVGLFGDIASFSFYPGKNLGAYGDAGCLITNNDELALKCRRYANHGALVKHEHDIEGVNSRLDGLQAAILNAKLPFILKWTDARRGLANRYYDILSDIAGIELPSEASYAKHVYHLFVIRCSSRDKVQKYLSEAGIGTAIHYPTPLPLMKAYTHLGYNASTINITDKYSREILSIPMYPELTEDMQLHVKNTLELISKY
ncbi:DegT/DnrJ/EryC1/StrS aminotransferase family protein [Reichenbachiella sp. MSK19-1]|uniref:DegT/DnrJ/EryC1/StrS family aminotransferase n=1 Tax=Reichenbachiella sp. MSK19-1 TaxID=1897631 RepID=UPI000E6C6BB4|nr:DegT/DnrJ/EryC1/StrS family aminotransferase [Reichenbachiella sp. MSK19-1]RJE71710.1 erythromycin biosynthesis sensory transduction protein eryC1 [Reichenbachiella sp. MSK19-1]